MIITHYFPNLYQNEVISDQKLFTSITEYTVQDQQVLAAQLLCSSGRALRRFDQLENYMQRRIQTEQWLYSAFLEIGGRPRSSHPFYFILGKNDHLKNDFGPNAGEIVLDTTQISACDISFTLGDSIGIYFSTTQKRLYSLDEIESILQNTPLVQEQMALLEQYHQYIEVQLWNKRYLSAAQVIRHHPQMMDNSLLSTVILLRFLSNYKTKLSLFSSQNANQSHFQ